MRLNQARELLRSLAQEYFAGAQVVFANQSRTPMQNIPLLLLTPGSVKRPTHPNYETVDGVQVANYLSRFSLTVDLFTNGVPRPIMSVRDSLCIFEMCLEGRFDEAEEAIEKFARHTAV